MVLKDKYIILDNRFLCVNRLSKYGTEYTLYTYPAIDIHGNLDHYQVVTYKVDGLQLQEIKENAMERQDLKNYPHYFI